MVPMRTDVDILARMHTAEHILSAVLRRTFGSPHNVEMHLGRKKSKSDYVVGRALSEADVRGIEAAVDAQVVADHPVSVIHITREAAADRLDLWKVPPEAEEIRVVRIGEFDETPCSGDHVERTGQIGRFVIRSVSMKDREVVRIRFVLEDADSLE
jgi:misacylated tRNA(Ala) deacylase